MTRICPKLIHTPGTDSALKPDLFFSSFFVQRVNGVIQGVGGVGEYTTSVNFYCFLASSHFSENTRFSCSNSPCDTKSVKTWGLGDPSGGQASDQRLRERGNDRKERTDSFMENGERAGKSLDRASPCRRGFRLSLVAAVFSTSAPSANAFWGKGFRLLSYVQQAQTAKRFAKGRVRRLLVYRRRRRLQPRMSPNPGAEQAGSHQRAPARLSFLPCMPPAFLQPLPAPPDPSFHFPHRPRSPTQPAQPLERCVEGEKRSAEGN